MHYCVEVPVAREPKILLPIPTILVFVINKVALDRIALDERNAHVNQFEYYKKAVGE